MISPVMESFSALEPDLDETDTPFFFAVVFLVPDVFFPEVVFTVEVFFADALFAPDPDDDFVFAVVLFPDEANLIPPHFHAKRHNKPII